MIQMANSRPVVDDVLFVESAGLEIAVDRGFSVLGFRLAPDVVVVYSPNSSVDKTIVPFPRDVRITGIYPYHVENGRPVVGYYGDMAGVVQVTGVKGGWENGERFAVQVDLATACIIPDAELWTYKSALAPTQ